MAKKLYIPRSLLVEAEQFDKIGILPTGVKADATSATGYTLDQEKIKKDITPETLNTDDKDLHDINFIVKKDIADKSYIVGNGGSKMIISESDFNKDYIEVKI